MPVAEKVEAHDRGLDYVSDKADRLETELGATEELARENRSKLDEKLDKTGGQLTGRLVTDSPIWIHPGGQGANGEQWAEGRYALNQAGADTGSVARFQQNGEDILKIEHAKAINACGNNITNLADPEHERHAVTKQWAEGRICAQIRC